MRRAEARSQQRAVRCVQLKEGGRGRVVKRSGAMREGQRADRRVARHRAFQAQERQLVEGVDFAQAHVELERVDDHGWLDQANMLGAQVAMALDDVVPAHACSQQIFVPHHRPVHAVDQVVNLRQLEARTGEHAATRTDFVAQALEVLVLAESRSTCLPIEGYQHAKQRVDVVLPQLAAGDHLVQHALRRQPLHRHQPVDGAAESGQQLSRNQREDAIVPLRRQQAQIDAWREPPVHEQFGAGVAFARLHGREVEERQVHRLLQFQNALGTQQEPRHVRLDANDGFADGCRCERRRQIAQLGLHAGRVVSMGGKWLAKVYQDRCMTDDQIRRLRSSGLDVDHRTTTLLVRLLPKSLEPFRQQRRVARSLLRPARESFGGSSELPETVAKGLMRVKPAQEVTFQNRQRCAHQPAPNQSHRTWISPHKRF